MRIVPGCGCLLCRDPVFRAQVKAKVPEWCYPDLHEVRRYMEAQARQAMDFAASPERQSLERSWNAPAAEVYE